MENNDNSEYVLIFSHEQDVDGLLSAAVLKMAYTDSKVVLTNYGFDKMVAIRDKVISFTERHRERQQQQPNLTLELEQDSNRTKTEGKATIIIADIGVNEDSHKPIYEALSISMQEGISNIWIDHHPWPEEMKEKFSNVCELVLYQPEAGNDKEEKRDTSEAQKIAGQPSKEKEEEEGKREMTAAGSKKMCTTELCIERFHLNDRSDVKILGAIAHRTDFPDSTRFPIPPLTALISYYLGKNELNQKLHSVILDNVVKGILWNTSMQEDMIEASRQIDESIERSLERVAIREFTLGIFGSGNDSTYAIAQSPSLPSSSSSTTTHQERKIRVAIAKADSFVSRSMLLGRVMDKYNNSSGINSTAAATTTTNYPESKKNSIVVDLAIAYTDDGRISIRRADNQPSQANNDVASLLGLLDCGKIAATFREGGGHMGAAGGFLKANVREKGDDAAIVEIESTLQNYFEQLEERQRQPKGLEQK